MSKFLPIGTKGELLNSDMIARIIPKEDGGCIILTKDGQHFHSEIDLHDEVNDYNSIRSIIPCQGVSAVYLDDDGDSEICPCAFVMLMSDGKIEPFVFATDKDIERIANKGHPDRGDFSARPQADGAEQVVASAPHRQGEGRRDLRRL